MSNALTAEQVKFFKDSGYLYPLRAISPAEAARCREKSKLTKQPAAKRSINS
jgi:hypothetical protein